MSSVVFIRTEDIARKDELINVFDKFDVLGIKWEIILDELLVDDVTFKFLKISFDQFNTNANKSSFFWPSKESSPYQSFFINSTLGSILYTTD